jgi:hypothetical protein
MKISELNLNISHKTKFIYLLEVSGSKWTAKIYIKNFPFEKH